MDSQECDIHWIITAIFWIGSAGPPCHVDVSRSTGI